MELKTTPLSNRVNKLAELDTTILRYNREYPLARRLFGGNAGFTISQATEFDHRMEKVVTETKKRDGSLNIIKKEKGETDFFISKNKTKSNVY